MSSKRPVSPGAEEILGAYFPVLDHGFVALVDYMGTDECIERAARVSYGYGTRKASLTRGLLRYLRRHLHNVRDVTRGCDCTASGSGQSLDRPGVAIVMSCPSLANASTTLSKCRRTFVRGS